MLEEDPDAVDPQTITARAEVLGGPYDGEILELQILNHVPDLVQVSGKRVEPTEHYADHLERYYPPTAAP